MTDHELAIAFAKLLGTLKTTQVEKYRYFFNNDSTCRYTKKSLQAFIRTDKERLLKDFADLAARIEQDE